MKIVPPSQPDELAPTQRAPAAAPSETGPSFGEVLEQAAGPSSPPTSGAPAIRAISRPPHLTASRPVAQQGVARQVAAGLDALDAYRNALADPRTSLREVADLLSDLEHAQQALGEGVADLAEHHPLRQIGEQASTVIIAEKARFDGGIYS